MTDKKSPTFDAYKASGKKPAVTFNNSMESEESPPLALLPIAGDTTNTSLNTTLKHPNAMNGRRRNVIQK